MESINVIVETERLILRRYVEGDAQDLYEYLSNPEVVKYEPYKPMDPDEVKSNLAWRISTDEMIAVELKSNHKMIGNVYLGKREFDALEMGYVFNQDYWGKGYAKDIIRSLCREIHSQGKIPCIFAPEEPSYSIFQELGFEIYGRWGAARLI